MEAALAFHEVSKAYPALWRRKKVLEGLSLEVGPGEAVGLFGPNGAGKSTILHLAAGFLRPDAGKVTVGGASPWSVQGRAFFGFVPENPNFPPGLSLEGFLELQLACLAPHRPASWEQAEQLLERLDLAGARKRQVSQFSRGMKQKTALVAALLGSPPLLLLDEPISGLDPQAVAEVRQLLQEHRARGGAVLVSSHLLDETAKVCHRALFIQRGRIVHQWREGQEPRVTLAVLFEPPAPPGLWEKLAATPWVAKVQADSHRVTLALVGREAISPVLLELLQSGLALQGVEQQRTSLEEVFCEVIR